MIKIKSTDGNQNNLRSKYSQLNFRRSKKVSGAVLKCGSDSVWVGQHPVQPNSALIKVSVLINLQSYSLKESLVFHICDALHDLVAFVQFKKREKHPWRSNFTEINTPQWVVFTFFKVHKCYQVAQRITYKKIQASSFRDRLTHKIGLKKQHFGDTENR